MLKSLYDWMMRLAQHSKAVPALFGVSFVESSVFPIPPDVMLVPMVLADRKKAWYYALVATIGSVLGGILGYVIGYWLFDQIGEPLLAFYGYQGKFDDFKSWYNDPNYGAWIVFTAGVTPFPYKVITIASGISQLNFAVFVMASIAARSLRFFAVAALLYWFGPPIRDFIEKRLGLVFTVFVVLLFGGFFAIKYLVH